MEFNSSILLYSKYSVSSKKLIDFINSSGIDLTNLIKLQLLCIDNEEVRKRIIKNKQIDITSVPCLLLIYQDGGLEKYDSDAVFKWFEQIIKKNIDQRVDQRVDQKVDQRVVKRVDQRADQRIENISEEIVKNEPERTNKKYVSEKKKLKKEEEKNRKNFENRNKTKAVTSIDDLISEEDNVENIVEESEEVEEVEERNVEEREEVKANSYDNDRYKNKKPNKLIRVNRDNYEEDDNLFQGTPPNNRENKKSAIKKSEGTDIMSKAKELAKGRENEMPPPGHPLAQKNN